MNVSSSVTPPPDTKVVFYKRWRNGLDRWYVYLDNHDRLRSILKLIFWIVVLLLFVWAMSGIIPKLVAEAQDGISPHSLNPPAASPETPNSPAPSPATSSSAPPSSSPSQSPRCVSPAEPASGKIGLVVKTPASEATWLSNFKGTALTRVVYNGDPASPDALKAWADTAACNGMSAEIRPDKVSGNAGALQGANTVSALCWDDWPATGKCRNDYLPVYLPFPEPNNYGSVASYTDVGRAATSGWAAVQAFGWRDAIKEPKPDPAEVDFVNKMHFPDYPVESRPTPDRVGEFARMLHDGGASNILIYTESPAAGDVAYLKDCISRVAAVLGR